MQITEIGNYNAHEFLNAIFDMRNEQSRTNELLEKILIELKVSNRRIRKGIEIDAAIQKCEELEKLKPKKRRWF